jgi:hypothetical protein
MRPLLILWLLAFLAVACDSNDGKLKVTGLEPRSGDALGNQYVIVHGQNFQKTNRSAKIYFGDQSGQVIKFQGDDEMVVVAPGGKAGETVDVLIKFDPGGEIMIPKAYTFIEKKDVGVDDLGNKEKK